MPSSNPEASRGAMNRVLNGIERVGNRLPHPAMLFVYMALAVLVVSVVCAWTGVSATHPVTSAEIQAVNLMSGEGLRRILEEAVTNFTGFAPLGVVLVAMLGIGIAESSGLIGALLRRLVLTAPSALLSFIVALAGILSSLAADSGYVVLIPLAALVFISAGRHPVAGIACAFAAVSAGFSANLLIGPLDALLAGLSTEGIQLLEPDYVVSPAANWWFIIASTVVLSITVALVTEFITEKRLPPAGEHALQEPDTDVAPERRGLLGAGIATLILLLLILLALLPADGVLRNPETGGIFDSPFIASIVVIIALWAGIAGIVYGKVTGAFRNSNDVIEGMEATMGTMAGYLVMMFFAAQFVAWFGWTNLGLITAIVGSDILSALEPGPILLLCLFILVTFVINLLIGSASAKWAIMAPVFVPMLYLLGIAPEGAQMAYRIGDSVSNIVTPLMPYFALVVAFAAKYDKNSGIGTIVATMLPYSLILLVVWTALLSIWLLLGLPLGPDAYFLVPE